MDFDFTGALEESRAAAKKALTGCRTADEKWGVVRAALAERDYANALTMRATTRYEAILDLVAPSLPYRGRKTAEAFGEPLDGRIAALQRAAEKAEKAGQKRLAASDMAYEEAY